MISNFAVYTSKFEANCVKLGVGNAPCRSCIADLSKYDMVSMSEANPPSGGSKGLQDFACMHVVSMFCVCAALSWGATKFLSCTITYAVNAFFKV